MSSQYIHDVWTTRQGLPQDTITSITQDRTGFIWFGTQEGLVRFDGVNFKVFDARNTEAIADNWIPVVFADPENGIWFGGSDGLIRYRDGVFDLFDKNNGLTENASVKNISVDADGVFWLGYNRGDKISGQSGLGRLKDGLGTMFTTDDGLAANQIYRTLPDRNGGLWIATSKGLNFFKDGKFDLYTVADGLTDNQITTLYQDRQGRLWVGTLKGLNLFSNGIFKKFDEKEGLLNDNIRAVLEDRDGIVWIATDTGLHRLIDGRIEDLKDLEVLGSEEIQTLFEDSEGSIWIGTRVSGLHRLRDSRFSVFGKREGLPGENVTAILESADGRMFFGTNPGGLSVFQDRKITNYLFEKSIEKDRIGVLYSTGSDVLVGTRDILNRFDGKQLRTFFRFNDTSNLVIRSILQTSSEEFLVGTNNGLYRFTSGDLEPVTYMNDRPARFIHAIVPTSDGKIWLATDEDTGYFDAEGKFTVFPNDYVRRANVVWIYEDLDKVLWLATWGQGLMRLKNGELSVFLNKDGLFDNTQWSIVEDDLGFLWMGSNRGIFRIDKKELNDFADKRVDKINSRVFGTSDGLRKSENNLGNPSAFKSRDGRLWFSTTAGAAVVDPNNLKINHAAPPVVIEQVLSDERTIETDNDFVIPADALRVEIRVGALTFINPEEVKFKFRLEGFDNEWIDAGNRRSAFYTNLPPGNYEFKVIAANSDGVWNEKGAAIRLSVSAPFWRTWWFRILLFAALAGLVFLYYRRRLNTLEKEKAVQQRFSEKLIDSQEKERKRIARELHDGLGQNLVIIKNRALISLNSPNDQDKLLAQLEEISQTASASIAEVRDIARNLHPYQMEYLGLKAAIESVVKSASESSGIEFSNDIDDPQNRLSKSDEINIFRIVQEAVSNVVKHSGAQKATVSLRFTDSEANVKISDDGRGFSESANENQPGLGLIGITERARIMDARPTIISSSSGTIVQIRIDMRNYEKNLQDNDR